MKVKFDFVTNSSSVSFVAIGANIKAEDISKEIISKLKENGNNIDIDKIDESAWNFEIFIKGSDLALSSGPEYYPGDGISVGIEYGYMEDDETLMDFKSRVQQQIMDCFGIETIPGHIEQCWRDA